MLLKTIDHVDVCGAFARWEPRMAQEKLKELISWCWKGPEGAAEVGLENSLTAKRKVTDVEVIWEEAKGTLGAFF